MVKGYKLIIPFFALLISLSLSFPNISYAVDTNYLSGENIEERFWSDCKNVINIDKNNLIGNIKYIPDSNNHCFYMRIQFHSTASDYEAEKVQIRLNISNSENSYRLVFDNTGENEELLTINNDNFKICYSFDLYPSKRRGGYVYIGFDFKNKTDKSLNNFISCEYSCGAENTYLLFENVNIDMFEPTTQKSSSTKKTTAKSAKTTAKQNNKTTSKTTGAKQNSTKYAPSNQYSSNQNDNDDIDESEEVENNSVEENKEEVVAETSIASQPHLSDTAKKLMISAGIITALGIIAIIIGLSFKPKKTDSDFDENTDKTE